MSRLLEPARAGYAGKQTRRWPSEPTPVIDCGPARLFCNKLCTNTDINVLNDLHRGYIAWTSLPLSPNVHDDLTVRRPWTLRHLAGVWVWRLTVGVHYLNSGFNKYSQIASLSYDLGFRSSCTGLPVLPCCCEKMSKQPNPLWLFKVTAVQYFHVTFIEVLFVK